MAKTKGIRGILVFPCIRAGASLKRFSAWFSPWPGRRFPLHSCRGLIEAAISRDAAMASPTVFPCIRAGASLKQGDGVDRLRPADVFPCIRAGASLKRRRCGDGGIDGACFPLHSCRGLIEAFSSRMASQYRSCFPLHSCRGLIEASKFPKWARNASSFPLHSCRGLIEAAPGRARSKRTG